MIFQPDGIKGEISEAKTVLEASRELGVEITSLCGGMGSCGKCKVKIEEGSFEKYGITSLHQHFSQFTEEEGKFIQEKERDEGYRLGCAARIQGDVMIFIPEESRGGNKMARKAATERSIELKPAIGLYFLELSPPTFHDPLGDFDRLKKALIERYHLDASIDIDYSTLLKLSHTLRQGDWKVTVAIWMEKEIIDINPGKVHDFYGLAVDVGTTTVVGYLCNLQNGRLIATETMTNPQVTFGEDIMSRITYTVTHPEGLERMNRAIVNGLNRLVQTITGRCGLSPEDILEMTMVGNTAMHHLLLKIDPKYLGISPFPPAIHQSRNIKARELGLEIHRSGNVHILPLEAGFVGADNVGVLIAEEPYNEEEIVLIIDIGTNGELVMGNKERLVSASCATGPALEGAHIKFGMGAASGAIEKIEIDSQTLEVRFKVIGKEGWNTEIENPEAKGICGSGIVDGIAELYKNGLIRKNGQFRMDIQSPRFRIFHGHPEFVIAWKDETSIGKDITLTQQDVRNVQLAKGALYTGAKLLMKKLGIEKIDKVILAGAFGSSIDTAEAMVLGMFPDSDLKNVYAVGNAAGDGARITLLNRDKRGEAEEVAKKVEYIELTIEEDFQKEFIESLHIPHMYDPFPHLKGMVKDEILNQ